MITLKKKTKNKCLILNQSNVERRNHKSKFSIKKKKNRVNPS